MNEEYSEPRGLFSGRSAGEAERLRDLDTRLARLERSHRDARQETNDHLRTSQKDFLDIWESIHRLNELRSEMESRLQAWEREQDESNGRLQVLEGTLEPLILEPAALRAEIREVQANLDLQAEDLRGLERALVRVQQVHPESEGGLPEEVEALRAELRELRRDLDSQVALRLEELLATPGDGDPEDPSDADELLEFAPPSREALSQVEGSLADLARTLPPEPALRMEQELGELRSLLQALDQEEHFRRRAGEILRLLRERLLGRGPQAAFRRQIHDFLFLRVPDLLEDLKEAAHREELTPDALRGFQQALEGLLDKMGLEEFRPREGDLLTVSEHGLLRVERVGKPGLQGRIASCLRPGLRVRATGEIVRKAEVSVFP